MPEIASAKRQHLRPFARAERFRLQPFIRFRIKDISGANRCMVFCFQEENFQSFPCFLPDVKAPVAAAFTGGKHRTAAIGMAVVATGEPDSGRRRPHVPARMAKAVIFIKERQSSAAALSVYNDLSRLKVRTRHIRSIASYSPTLPASEQFIDVFQAPADLARCRLLLSGNRKDQPACG